MKNLLHYGMQRSGTNYLETLLKKNFRIRILNSNNDERDHPLQKHFRLYNQKSVIPEHKFNNNLTFNHFDEYLDALGIQDKIDGILIIWKDPYSWLISYRNWAKKCNWPVVEHHYAEEYNLFYSKWMDFAKQDDRIKFISYYDLLLNPDQQLAEISKSLKLEYTLLRRLIGTSPTVKKVLQSGNFTQSNVGYYLNKEYLNKYDSHSLEEVNNIIDPELMKFLNYDICVDKKLA